MPLISARRELAIDLGTSNPLVWARGQGLLLAAPTVVARDRDTGELLAAGAEARRMLGRATPAVEVVEPLRDGVVEVTPLAGVQRKPRPVASAKRPVAPPRQDDLFG